LFFWGYFEELPREVKPKQPHINLVVVGDNSFRERHFVRRGGLTFEKTLDEVKHLRYKGHIRLNGEIHHYYK
jgi:hypothetical protein